MTIQLTQQILMAERDVHTATEGIEGRFTPTARSTTRESSARLIRALAQRTLRLADRIDDSYDLAA